MVLLWGMLSESGLAGQWDVRSASLKAHYWADVTARWMGYETGLPSVKRWGLQKGTGSATPKACGLDLSMELRLGQRLATSSVTVSETPLEEKSASLTVPVWAILSGVWSANDSERRSALLCGDCSPLGPSQA